MIKLAIAKGRLFKQVRTMLQQTSWVDAERSFSERALSFPVSDRLEILVVRAVDVPVYVARGAAHVGICGLDTVLETDFKLLELADLGLGRCQMCLAGPGSQADKPVRAIATKFPNLTRKILARKGRSAELVKLNGALELAPLVGLSDAIVDLVETGRTLKDNGLEVWDELLTISTRIFTTEASLVSFQKEIAELTDAIVAQLAQEETVQ